MQQQSSHWHICGHSPHKLPFVFLIAGFFSHFWVFYTAELMQFTTIAPENRGQP